MQRCSGRCGEHFSALICVARCVLIVVAWRGVLFDNLALGLLILGCSFGSTMHASRLTRMSSPSLSSLSSLFVFRLSHRSRYCSMSRFVTFGPSRQWHTHGSFMTALPTLILSFNLIHMFVLHPHTIRTYPHNSTIATELRSIIQIIFISSLFQSSVHACLLAFVRSFSVFSCSMPLFPIRFIPPTPWSSRMPTPSRPTTPPQRTPSSRSPCGRPTPARIRPFSGKSVRRTGIWVVTKRTVTKRRWPGKKYMVKLPRLMESIWKAWTQRRGRRCFMRRFITCWRWPFYGSVSLL